MLPDSWMPGRPDPKLGIRTVFLHCKSVKEMPDVLTFTVHNPHVQPLAVIEPHMLQT